MINYEGQRICSKKRSLFFLVVVACVFGKDGACFDCVYCFHLLLYRKKYFVNERPSARFLTIMIRSRSICITVNKLAYVPFVVFVETVSARTQNMSNNALNWFICLFENVYYLVTHEEKRNYSVFKMNFAHLTRGHAFWTLLIPFAEKNESIFVFKKLHGKCFFWTEDVPMKSIMLLWWQQLGLNVLHIVVALNNFTLVCSVKSVLV